MKQNYFEDDYIKYGVKAQRAYPNTELISFIKKIIIKNKHKKIKVLEVGCGTGANLWMLSKEKLITYGIDNSKIAVKICKKNMKEKNLSAKVDLGSMMYLPYEKNFFDLVVDIVSMQNLSYRDHKITWQSIYNCLKPGGSFFSFHLGQRSTPFQVLKKEKKNLIDNYTLKNIPLKYPLSHKGEVCFLKKNQVYKDLKKIGYIQTIIDKTTRTYNSETFLIEYLLISSKK